MKLPKINQILFIILLIIGIVIGAIWIFQNTKIDWSFFTFNKNSCIKEVENGQRGGRVCRSDPENCCVRPPLIQVLPH